MQLRKAMIALGRYAKWSRADIRALTMNELEDYALAAQELEKDRGA